MWTVQWISSSGNWSPFYAEKNCLIPGHAELLVGVGGEHLRAGTAGSQSWLCCWCCKVTASLPQTGWDQVPVPRGLAHAGLLAATFGCNQLSITCGERTCAWFPAPLAATVQCCRGCCRGQPAPACPDALATAAAGKPSAFSKVEVSKFAPWDLFKGNLPYPCFRSVWIKQLSLRATEVMWFWYSQPPQVISKVLFHCDCTLYSHISETAFGRCGPSLQHLFKRIS